MLYFCAVLCCWNAASRNNWEDVTNRCPGRFGTATIWRLWGTSTWQPEFTPSPCRPSPLRTACSLPPAVIRRWRRRPSHCHSHSGNAASRNRRAKISFVCFHVQVKLCDAASGGFTHSLVGHREPVWAAAWSPTSEWHLVTGACDGQVCRAAHTADRTSGNTDPRTPL